MPPLEPPRPPPVLFSDLVGGDFALTDEDEAIVVLYIVIKKMEEGEVQSVIMQCMLECDVVKDRRAQLYRRIIDCYTVNLTGRKAK